MLKHQFQTNGTYAQHSCRKKQLFIVPSPSLRYRINHIQPNCVYIQRFSANIRSHSYEYEYEKEPFERKIAHIHRNNIFIPIYEINISYMSISFKRILTIMYDWWPICRQEIQTSAICFFPLLYLKNDLRFLSGDNNMTYIHRHLNIWLSNEFDLDEKSNLYSTFIRILWIILHFHININTFDDSCPSSWACRHRCAIFLWWCGHMHAPIRLSTSVSSHMYDMLIILPMSYSNVCPIKF